MTTMTAPRTLNGINTEALLGTIEAITQNTAKAMTHWEVNLALAGRNPLGQPGAALRDWRRRNREGLHH